MQSKLVIVFAGACAVAAASTPALAFVPWSNPSGSATWFTWSNGGSATGLFGSPTLVGGDTFLFSPAGFRAQSSGGGTNLISDTLEFDLDASSGLYFTDIMITEFGDYGLVGASGGSVSATGLLTVADRLSAASFSGAMTTTPGSPITSGTGSWQGSAAVTLPGISNPLTNIHVKLTNDLIAVSVGGSIAFIEKKVVGSAVALQILPAPSGLALLGLGGLAVSRRRR